MGSKRVLALLSQSTFQSYLGSNQVFKVLEGKHIEGKPPRFAHGSGPDRNRCRVLLIDLDLVLERANPRAIQGVTVTRSSQREHDPFMGENERPFYGRKPRNLLVIKINLSDSMSRKGVVELWEGKTPSRLASPRKSEEIASLQ